jgi:cytochrome c553
MSLRSLVKAAAPALVLAAVSLVHATPAAAAGDPVRGKTLGYTCLGCHGIETYKNVYPTFSVPKLRGQHAGYIARALKAYRKGDRSHGTMHAQATSLSDQDIDDVAAYLAGDAVVYDANATPVGTPPAAVATCTNCHGLAGVPDEISREGGSPSMAGQYADYLAHAIEGYRNGSRRDGVMQPSFVTNLSPADIKALTEFYAKQKPALATVPMKEKKPKEAK